MKVNKYQAAIIAGISRTTLDKHIRGGVLTVDRDTSGKTWVDIAELQRVYSEVDVEKLSSTTEKLSTWTTLDKGASETVQHENDRLRQQIHLLEAQQAQAEERHMILMQVEKERCAMRDEQIRDLREQCDKWQQQATAVTYLLTDQRETQPPTPSGFLARLFGARK